MYIDTMFDVRNIFDFFILILIYTKLYYPRWKQSKETFMKKTLFYVYLVGVIWVTLMPIVLNLHVISFDSYIWMHLRPFEDVIYQRNDALLQVFLNIFMMLPMGVFLPLIYDKRLTKTIMITFLCSLSIELLQPLITSTRTSDITDIITNTLGGLIGYFIFKLYKKIKSL